VLEIVLGGAQRIAKIHKLLPTRVLTAKPIVFLLKNMSKRGVTIYWHRKAFFENEDIDAGLDLAIFYKNLATKNKDNALHKKQNNPLNYQIIFYCSYQIRLHTKEHYIFSTLFFTPIVSINRILYFSRNIFSN
jgi:hypothetical protein